MSGLTAIAVGIIGLAVGFAAGFTVRRARLCTFGAVEDALVARQWRRMRAFALALGIAILGTHMLVVFAGFDPLTSTYVPARFAILGTLAGGVLFGLGMALVGTCAFGSLIRLGAGDLRAVVTLLIFALVAHAVLRGSFAGARIGLVESVAVAMPPGVSGSFADLAAWLWPGATAVLAPLIGTGLVLLALRDERLRRSPRLLTAALVLGAGTVAGWAATGVFADPFAEAMRVHSLTFVAPVARAVFALSAGEGGVLEFGTMSVFGVVAGAALSAVRDGEFRWEAFDDQREMRRHMAGAALMGLGGVLAGGCTIGQGLSAGSLLAISWPVAVLGMMLGARIGIGILIEGSALEWARVWTRRRERFPAE